MTLIRDPAWRKRDRHGALRIGPQDAATLELADGDVVQITTRRGSRSAPVEVSETMSPGHISLPSGYGLKHGPDGPVTGVAPNDLTDASQRDWLAGTPWHKHVPARL
jgi:anaerobic selenocysteine-containing dehydrogenase